MREICYIVEAAADGGSVFMVDMSVTAIRTDRFEYANLDRRTFQQRFKVSGGKDLAGDVLVNGPHVCDYTEQCEVVYIAIYRSARRAKNFAARYSAELRAYRDHFVAASAAIPSGSPSP